MTSQLSRVNGARAFLRSLALLLFIALIVSPHVAVGAPSVGVVTKVEKQAQVGRTPAGVGTVVRMNDVLLTGPESRLEVTFRDNTTLTLGANARVVIDRYVFNPEASTGALALKTSGAAYRMATGRIGEMQKKTITVSTPAVSLGVRGTDVWWGPIEGHYGVYLVHNAAVNVSNRFGSTRLSTGGTGTDIRRRSAPSRPYRWPAGKVNAALAQTNWGFAFGSGGWIAAAVIAGAATAIVVAATEDDSLPPLPPPGPISP